MARQQRDKQQTVDYIAVLQEKWAEIPVPGWLESARCLWNSLPALHRKILRVLTPLIVVIAIIPLPEQTISLTATAPVTPQRVEVGLDITPLSETRTTNTDPQTRSQQSAAALVRSAWISYTVKDGDTLSAVFRANDLPLSDLNALIKIEGSDKPLSNIRPGQLVRFKLNKQGELDILQLERSDQSIMFFRLSEGGFGRSQ